jgi:hypothetical protein
MQYVEFINALHHKRVFELIDAANFLGIESLLSLALAWVAFVIKSESAPRRAVGGLFGWAGSARPRV